MKVWDFQFRSKSLLRRKLLKCRFFFKAIAMLSFPSISALDIVVPELHFIGEPLEGVARVEEPKLCAVGTQTVKDCRTCDSSESERKG